MTNSIKVSFEITDNWEIDGFRNFIKLLLSDDNYEVYLISNDDSTAYILSVGSQLGLDSNRIIVTNFSNDKIDAITNNNIQIHIDNLQSFTLLVEETTDAYGILVTRNLNKYYLTPDYIITFNRLVELIKSNG